MSAAVIGPFWLTPMMMTGCRVDLPTSGSARLPATVLGALAGRKAELSLLTWLASDGRKCTEAAVPTSQTTTISQRNRTVKRPRPLKSAFIRPGSPSRAMGVRSPRLGLSSATDLKGSCRWAVFAEKPSRSLALVVIAGEAVPVLACLKSPPAGTARQSGKTLIRP